MIDTIIADKVRPREKKKDEIYLVVSFLISLSSSLLFSTRPFLEGELLFITRRNHYQIAASVSPVAFIQETC